MMRRGEEGDGPGRVGGRGCDAPADRRAAQRRGGMGRAGWGAGMRCAAGADRGAAERGAPAAARRDAELAGGRVAGAARGSGAHRLIRRGGADGGWSRAAAAGPGRRRRRRRRRRGRPHAPRRDGRGGVGGGRRREAPLWGVRIRSPIRGGGSGLAAKMYFREDTNRRG